MKNKKVVVVGVLLSEALSPLSELGESGGEFARWVLNNDKVKRKIRCFVSLKLIAQELRIEGRERRGWSGECRLVV